MIFDEEIEDESLEHFTQVFGIVTFPFIFRVLEVDLEVFPHLIEQLVDGPVVLVERKWLGGVDVAMVAMILLIVREVSPIRL